MTNPSEKGMRDTLLLEMGKCIEELIQDPYDKVYDSKLLSLHDVVVHLRAVGFELTWPKKLSLTDYVAEMLDGDDYTWTITGGGIYGGVTLERIEPDEDYYDDYSDDEYESGEYEPEDDGKPL